MNRKTLFVFLICSALFFLFVSRVHSADAVKIKAQSAILKNLNTGEILYSKKADRGIPPASITKVLTLYLVFEAIEGGRADPDDRVVISRKASRMKGSRMYVGEGEEVLLDDLIKGTAIVSGNDAAIAIAEHVDGDVDAFVRRMNRKAKALGMTRSHFRNPNGLPARGQVTTARDVLKLSESYLDRFPQSLEIHSMTSYTFQDVTQQNSNHLLEMCPDVDGLKTGFTRKSGYHIVVTAQRNGMRLMAVVMGAKSSSVRDREARRLIEEGFRMAGVPAYTPSEPTAGVKLRKATGLSGSSKTSIRTKDNRSKL
ncbi:MAG TPA: D-alanyl-D-alanine carboxypeptidase family protein [Syntrophales bacterium]|nr:D-alanyl-D-alanine carboxypeptidase family protein [Syntrophales bacterium]HPI56455.1 D-alanyl-D-alanine carboxypeptidase family protein [Syntrophales bacterium]HPN25124.1 D-alanyl-D-alanine carboxypeptidase family protein [Syntrophales bacterium]HQM29133.1 D-alanyl-D-alanine carboxypeptidase family protein [Syntrophales bacterium]